MNENLSNMPNEAAMPADDAVATNELKARETLEGADVVPKREEVRSGPDDRRASTPPSGTSEWKTRLIENAVDFSKQEVIRQLMTEFHERDMDRLEMAHQREVQVFNLKLQQANFDATQARWREEQVVARQNLLAGLQIETRFDKVRSLVLFAVVCAVVVTPILAMLRKIDPQAFVQYIAPITGITGTVLGYWFGRQEPALKRSPQTTFKVNGDEKVITDQS
jgi:hypothetical protein